MHDLSGMASASGRRDSIPDQARCTAHHLALTPNLPPKWGASCVRAATSSRPRLQSPVGRSSLDAGGAARAPFEDAVVS